MKQLILIFVILLLLPLAPLSSKGAERLLLVTGFGHFLFETVGEAGGFVDSGGANLTHGQVLDGTQIGVAEIDAGGVGFGKVGAVEFGARQFGVGQVGVIKFGLDEDSLAQVGPDEVDPDQVLPGEVGPVQVFFGQLRCPPF